MLPQKLDSLMQTYRDGLLRDTIPFWTRHSPDREHGGFLNQIDRDGTAYGTDKAIWLQGRAAWMFARLYNHVERRDEWLELSRHGLDFLRKHAFDRDGRMFFHVTRDGRPLRKRRYLFSETFAIIGLAEYAKATGDDAARQQAADLYKLVWRYYTTPGLCEPKTNPQTRPLKGHAMPMILLATTQILRQVDSDPLYQQVIDSSLHEVLHHFVKPQFKCLLETVGPQGEFVDEPVGREVNPGHAIETAWFILEEARHRNNDRELIQQACQILEWSLEIGWDRQFGGIIYYRDCRGLPCPQYEHDMKLWWPQTEAFYATLLAYHLTGERKYLDWHDKVLAWALNHFPDPQHGEWFGYLHRDGSPSMTIKGNLWKGIFHLPRAQLYCWKLLEQMKARHTTNQETNRP
jgi:N-acylglucosamine 2-epimerase